MPQNPSLDTRRRVVCAAMAGLAAAATQSALAQLAPPRPGAPPDQLDRILASRVLRVAVPKEFPPFGFIRNGIPEGYDIAIARMLALDMKVRLEIVPVASPDRLPYLQEGKVDLVIASLGKTAQREQLIDFSLPYAPLYIGVFGPAQGTAPDAAHFKGRRIGVTQGSLEDEELARRLPDAQAVRYENSAAIIEAYVKNQIDYLAVGNVVIESIKDVAVRDRTRRLLLLKDSPCHIGVHKDEARLLARVNRFLLEAGDSQALMINAMVWFKATLPADFFARPRSLS